MSYDPYDPDLCVLAIDKKKMAEDQQNDPVKFDAKKARWLPHADEGYVKSTIKGTSMKKKGKVEVEMTTVIRDDNKEEVTVETEQLAEINPPKFDKMEDMANLTYLNEGSILNNLKCRYEQMLIYTYSGLFCVAINPYKRLPIYTMNVVAKYMGKKRNEVPPHLFNIADNAYSNILIDHENQSMLITGESGAGKTENTKKVISYFAIVATAAAKAEGAVVQESKKGEKGSLEDQIVQANPVLEAYGNAKTTRNNNSSRFGKFIRIHFGPQLKIAGADVDTYLLEKSRITYQMPGCERNYHIFYFLLSNKFPRFVEMCLVDPDPSKYFFINQGCLTADGIDDQFECESMDDAFAVLGFNNVEKEALFRATTAVLWFGEMKWKQRPREEQADIEDMKEAKLIASLLKVDAEQLVGAMLHPKVKVGAEMVIKAQNAQQVQNSTNAIAKSLYVRFFNWLVLRINMSFETGLKQSYFIGVLDIAGFEIFEFNTFEQLCINYTNERLQQFFNHHMFVLEQEEYKKEGVQWTFIDFGMDLQACIDLIEKPLGILSILEEECMFPKASDKSFKDKLYENHLGKSKMFGKPKVSKSARFEAHFELYHYAGVVQYNADGWLDKNKDPINVTVVECLSSSGEDIVKIFFPKAVEEEAGGGKKKKGGGGFQTISGVHKESLGRLMATLYKTHPHFVRCIIPNEMKKSGMCDANLILGQLRCNGVLEGIRICRKGFPNRIMYPEFKSRYSVLGANAIMGASDPKLIAERTLAGGICLDADQYRIGYTKVFFRAGVLGGLEDMRDDRIDRIMSLLTGMVRMIHVKRTLKRKKLQRLALMCIQRNLKKWFLLKDCLWYELFGKLRPSLQCVRAADEMLAAAEELEKRKKELELVEATKVQLEAQQAQLIKAKNDMEEKLLAAQEMHKNAGEAIAKLEAQRDDLDATVTDLETRLAKEEGSTKHLSSAKKQLTETIENLKKDLQDLEVKYVKAEEDRTSKDAQITTLEDEFARQEELIAKLQKDKKALEEQKKDTEDNLAQEEDKTNHYSKVKQKLERGIDEMEETLERERKLHSDVDKVRKKIENDLKMTQETVEELERLKLELEETVRRKETEYTDTNSKLEDEGALIAQLKKKIKELQTRIEELEEELESEKNSRGKAEKTRTDLQRELEELSEKLDEAGGATSAQMDLNKKREAELYKLRHDMEEQQLNAEANLNSLKKKKEDACAELSDNLDKLQKSKTKIEKEKDGLKTELEGLQAQIVYISKGKSNSEKLAKSLELQLSDAMLKQEESSRKIQEMSNQKGRLVIDNQETNRLIDEVETQIATITKQKNTIAKQLDEAKGNLEEESRLRTKLAGEVRNLHADIDTLKDQLEDEQEQRAELQIQLTKANNEMTMWRQKFESGEGGVGPEAIEELKKKLNSKVVDAESQLEAALLKASNLEKQKNRLQGELEDCVIEMERQQGIALQADKKQRAFDKAVEDWKRKVIDLQRDIDTANAESRGNMTELNKLRAQIDESNESIEALKRENKNLQDEINELNEQLGEGGRSVHEQEKVRKRLEIEKDELQIALEEVESALEQEESKVMKAQLEIQSIKQDIDRRLAEKEEEFENIRKNHQRQLDAMQSALEAESRSKAESLRMKKKLEHDINELEIALETANRQKADAEKNIKNNQQQVKEIQIQIEEAQRSTTDARELFQSSERKALVLSGELEEVRANLETAERSHKTFMSELHEAHDRVTELTTTVTSNSNANKKLEVDIQAIQADLDEAINELKSSEDMSKRAMSDAARLADELRNEQEHTATIEKMKRQLEGQTKELQARLDEAEANAMKGGKRMLGKLEQRVKEIETELDNEQRKHAETIKTMRKQERRLKEVAFQNEEDQKAQERMQDQIDKLQQKIKQYKKQVEEAEEIAALNLSKYRKVQHELEDAEERADMSENTLCKLRAKNRSGSCAKQME